MDFHPLQRIRDFLVFIMALLMTSLSLAATDSTRLSPSNFKLWPIQIRTVQLPGQGAQGVKGSICYGMRGYGTVNPFVIVGNPPLPLNAPIVIPRTDTYVIRAKATVCGPDNTVYNISIVVRNQNKPNLVVNFIPSLMQGKDWHGTISAYTRATLLKDDVIYYTLDTTVQSPHNLVFENGTLDIVSQ